MDQTTKETLVKAVELLKAGDTKTAAQLLAKILKTEPELVQGWYLLGLALDDPEQKIRAFKRVLKLDPNHEKARNQLEKLEIFESDDWAPFSGTAAEPEIEPSPEPDSEAQDDFKLPDWMRAATFDPADHATEIPAEVAQNIFDDADAEIPEWAQQNPLESSPEPEAQPTYSKKEQPFEDNRELESLRFGLQDNELTGYYDDSDEEAEPEDDQEWEPQPVEEDQNYSDRVKAFFAEEDQGEDGPARSDQPEWLRDMVEDDGSGKKRKKEKVPKKLLSPEQKRKRRKIITYLFILVLCIGLGAGAYTYQEELKPYVEPYISPLLTRAAPVTDLLTQGAPLTYLLTPDFNVTPTITSTPPLQPTMEPTWTPSGGQAPIGTSAPNQPATGASTTIIPTALPLPEDTVAEMQAIEEQVKAVRNLPGPMEIEREIMPNYKLRQVMEIQLVDEEVLEQLKTEEIVLRALGFINATSDYDLTQAFLNSRGDALGGYYDPVFNKLNLVGSGFFGVEKYIYAHEYAHALQDANFDLNSLGFFPTCSKSIQACLAIQALVEGEASLVNQLWLDQYPPESGLEEIQNFQPPEFLFTGEAEPPYYSMNAYFVENYGLSFVKYLFDNGGWNGVNRAYAVLPETTEQVMHPIKYQQREAPLFLDHPDLSPVFREDWELIRRDMLGEWESYLLLAHNDYSGARRPEAEASVAAEGWGADEYRIYYNQASNDIFLSAFWIWDTAAEAGQFHTSLFASLSTRFGSNQVNGPGESGTCWFYDQQLSCLYQNEQQVLWLMSDNQEILESAKAKFTKFP